MTVLETPYGPVQVVRSDRRSMSLGIGKGGLIVRAPRRMADADILAFLARHKRWIHTHTERATGAEASAQPPLTEEELRALTERARRFFAERVAYYAPLVGVQVGRITIRHQKGRWGSCSARGNLNFNCLLMLAPPEVADSVVVHELCHRKHMNHSAAFYAEVRRVCPDYDRQNAWLKEHSIALLRRLPD